MTDDGTLPVPIDNGHGQVSALDQLAEMIPKKKLPAVSSFDRLIRVRAAQRWTKSK